MKLQIYSNNFAENILSQEPFSETYRELLWICENTPLPIYKNKSNAQKKLDVIQQIMDTYLNMQLKFNDWKIDDKFEVGNEEFITIDYQKNISSRVKDFKLHLEVEFGNVASSYRNYFKLQYLHLRKASDIGFLILPTESLARRIDSGVATFEKSVNEIISVRELFNFPLMVIGLDDRDTSEWQLNKSSLTLKELQSKASNKHELAVIEYIQNLKKE
mgnify:CR=1 FL=1